MTTEQESTTEGTPAAVNEINAIVGVDTPLHLDGADVDVYLEELRTRQLLKFLKILVVGAGPLLADLRINEDTDQQELTQQLIGVLLVSIPEAEDEIVDFIRSMVKPADLIPEKSGADRKINVQKYTELYTLLDNPKPEDSIDILIRVVTNEAPNMIALGKRLATLIPSVASLAGLNTSSKKPTKKPTRSAS